ncbi:hypothetical protein HN953_02975 [Candidatus Woesearchaeota archaeon]|nr:hypothetical protein [Candidatus Woesearchaeota archaeon]
MITKEKFVNTYKYKNFGLKQYDYLEKKEILPIVASPILANIIGHLTGDGSLSGNFYNGAIRFYGTKEKLKGIEYDMLKLFNKKSTHFKEKVKNSFELRYNDALFHRLFFLLEVPKGDKPITEFGVPKWIMQGNKEIKRAYLQAICDDELSTPRKIPNKINSWDNFKLKFSKSENLLDCGTRFLTQIKNMFEEFNISSGNVGITGRYERKDGVITRGIYINLSVKIKNRINFYKEINFKRESKKRSLMYESVKYHVETFIN